MITIRFSQLEKPISVETITTIDITSPMMFATFITNLNANLLGVTESDEITLFEDDAQIALSYLLFVYDVLTFDFNARPITTAIQKSLQKRVAMNPELWEPIEKQTEMLNGEVKSLLLGEELDLTFDDEWDIGRICKAFAIELKCDPMMTCLERAERIIEITEELHLAKLIVFKNLYQILSQKERKQLFMFALHESCPILVLELREKSTERL